MRGFTIFLAGAFLILFLSASIYTLGFDGFLLVNGNEDLTLMFQSMLASGVGGAIYCLRGVYLNACVFNRWSSQWMPWYFIRPFVSLFCGAVAFIFLKAGLLVLEAEQNESASNYAIYALAFIAGYNVDKFLEKIEKVSKELFGIETSRAANQES